MTTATLKLTALSRTLAFAGAFAALAVSTTSFAAAPGNDPPSVAVRYDDLNLSTTDGVNALYRRITVAARQVCPDPYSHDLAVVAASERCQATAIAKAVGEVNNPQLAALHATRVSHG
jgi:UrcA family protein